MPEMTCYAIKEKATKELLIYTLKSSRKVCLEDFFEGTQESEKELYECVKVILKYS